MDVPYRTKESIRGEIRKLVDPGVYARGFNYYRDGLVGEIELYTVGKPDSVGVRAKVFGTKAYSTSFTFSEQDGISNVRCSCPYEWGYCKHAVALGLKYSSELYGRQGGLASDHSEPAEGVLMRKSGLLDSTDQNEKRILKKSTKLRRWVIFLQGHTAVVGLRRNIALSCLEGITLAIYDLK